MRVAVFSIVLAAIAPQAVLAGEEIVNLDFFFVNDPIEAKGNTPSGSNDTVGIAARDMSMLDSSALLDKRQSRCPAGYSYCTAFGRCCPDTSSAECCAYGFCLEPGQACCPNGPCKAGQACCGRNHCRPQDSVCCSDESYCEMGNTCVRISGYSYDVCCTNTRCTAYVTGGSTVTRTTTTSILRTSTANDDRPTTTSRSGGSGSTNTYYFTITWTYWVYYWYYVIEIRASVVTSSITTTSSSVRVTAADSSAASVSFAAISASIPTTTPEQTLSALAGSTSFLPGAGPSASSTLDPDTSASTPSSTTSSTSTSARTTGPTVVVSGGANGAANVRLNTWMVMGLWAGIGGIVGVLMVAL